MVCFNTAFRVRGVGMEGVKMSTYRFDWAEALTIHELSVGRDL